MPVTNTTTIQDFVGDGVDNSPYTWPRDLHDDDDVEVIYITVATGAEVVKTKTTDYTIAIASTLKTADLTLVTTAPATGETMRLRRAQPNTQNTTYEDNDGNRATVIQRDTDRSALQSLTQQEQLDRTVQVSKGTPASDLPLPPIIMVGHGEEILRINTAGTAIETVVDSTSAGAVAGPASATDNAVTRFDSTTGKIIQNSVAILDDAGALSALTKLTVSDGSSGATAISTADTVVIESSAGQGPGGLSILGDQTDTVNFFLGTDADALGASFIHDLPNTRSILQTNASGHTLRLGGDNGEIAIDISGATTSKNVTLTSGTDLVITDDKITVGGVIIAGSGTNQITTTAGLIDHAKIDPAIAGSGITNTSGVLSVALGSGDVTGPGASVTDNAVATCDGTGGLTIKETGVVMTVAGAVSGVTTISASGAVTASSDSDSTHTFGKGRLGSPTTDVMHLSHFDQLSTTGYAVKQNAAGATILNSASGLAISLATANTVGLTLNGIGDVNVVNNLSVGTDFTVTTGDVTISAGVLTVTTGDVTISAGDLLVSNGTALANGTEALPPFAPANDPDSGMFRNTTNQLGFSTGGSSRVVFGDFGIRVVPTGTASIPAIARASDSNTGLWWGTGPDAINIATAGVDRMSITTVITIPSLAGTGSRTVVADANGVLSAP